MTTTQRATGHVAAAVFAAALAAAVFIKLPIPGSPLPIVVQNLLAVLAGLVLGPWFGLEAVLLFLMAGALGAPVFSGGRGGFAVFLGPSGGYLAGYALAALVGGALMSLGRRSPLRSVLASVVAFAAIYLLGVGRLATLPGSSLAKAIAGGLLPFLAVDAAKAAVAAAAAHALEPFAADILGRRLKRREGEEKRA